jgi:voltage-gated potassium channel Kch
MQLLSARPHSVDWSLTALLVVQAVTLFVAVPLGMASPATHVFLDGCHLLYALICVAALARHRLFQLCLLVGLAALVGMPILAHAAFQGVADPLGGTWQHDLIEMAAFAFNLAVTLLVAGHVFGPGRVTGHRVRGAVLLYLNIAALFAIAFGAILSHWPGAIILTTGAPLTSGAGARSAALTYFSLATLTTTGYGDVVPVLPLARSLANMEAVVGQLFPATLLARIVALHMEHSRDAD